jgi:mRNA interferase RelE/StbE
MSFHIELTRSAAKDLDRLSENLFERIETALEKLSQNPRHSNALKLTNRMDYRVRVGDYRILYSIDDDSQTVIVTSIEHRKNAYR